jgi:hypothetical protein
MSPNPNIAKLVKQVVSLKKESEVTLFDVPGDLIAGRTALRNAALQQYQETFQVLKAAIGAHAGGIFLTGPGAVAFADIAQVEGPSLLLSVSEMYAKVAEDWYPTVRVDQTFALDCIMSFLGGVNKLLGPLGIRELARPDFGKHLGRPVHSFEDAVAITRDVLRETVGDDLNGLYLNHRLAEEAAKAEWSLSVVPVVFLNATEAELKAPNGLVDGLCAGRNIVGAVEKETVTKAEVLSVFERLRVKMSPQKQPTLPPTDPAKTK